MGVRQLAVIAALAAYSAPAWAQPTSTVMVPMSDNTGLATDVYLPDGAGPFPVVLIRTPYDREGALDIGNALRGVGVATVAQDLRGRFASEGTDCVFLCDGDDGLDTLTWLDAQSWGNGHVVSWGGSALGIVQYMAAPNQPPGLSAMMVTVGTTNVYQDAFFQAGAFRQSLMEGWLTGQGSTFFLDSVSAHPLDDGFWDRVQTADRYGSVNVPALHVGGWFDIFGQGTIDAFVGYQHKGGAGAAGKQKLVMGAWTHGGVGGVEQGELVFPPQAAQPPTSLDDLQSVWLLHYLGLQPSSADVDAIPAVQYYVMGAVDEPGAPGNEWRSADDWPVAAAPVRMHLQPDGGLTESCPPATGGTSTYVYDPSNPTPTTGGPNLVLPAGPHDQQTVEARSDVVTFSTDVLPEPVEVTGRVRAHVLVDTNVPDTDIVVRITDVYPDGRSMLILDGIQRLGYRSGATSLTPVHAGEVVEAVVDLWSTSIVFAAGHRIRVSVTSSNATRFWANPNDGTTYGGVSAPVPATVSIHHDTDASSYLELPVPQRAPDSIVTCSAPGPDAGTDASVASDGSVASDASDGDADGPRQEAGTTDAGTNPSGEGAPADASDDGCGCRASGASTRGLDWLLALGLSAGLRWRRRRTGAWKARSQG